MNHLYEKAINAEKSRNYSRAAKQYALYAFKILTDSEYTSLRKMRLGVTHMLESISADVRANNTHRATLHYNMVDPVFEELFQQTDNQVIEGLLYEWQGDSLWMLKDERAREKYQLAFKSYEDISLSEQMFWGAEPEYDNAYGAVSEFLKEIGESYPESHSMDFRKRVQYKLELMNEESR